MDEAPVALVTGSARGIGQVIGKALLSAQYSVVFNGGAKVPDGGTSHFGEFRHLIEVNRLTIDQCKDCTYGEGQPEPECDRKRWDFAPIKEKVLETSNLNLFKESEFNKWRKMYNCPMNIPKIP